jgi:2,5-diamino-6-(ribosylamino)-4(3H)-pyrimidinone 5'-phosphate reductase
MGPSIDGRIVTATWGSLPSHRSEYERTAQTFEADAWIVGRVSMEPYAGKTRVPHRKTRPRIPRTDFIADRAAKSYAIAIDPSGKLTWRSKAIDGEHVITILSQRVSDDYLAFLRSQGVSYLFGGRAHIDLTQVLGKLANAFGIRRVLLEGGGKINGSFLVADLIDELSVLIAPIADGSTGTATLLDATARRGPSRHLRLIAIERLQDDLVWLRYSFRRRASDRGT